MIKLKTKWFNKWAKKNLVYDSVLQETIQLIPNKSNIADLGGGLYKVRTPKEGAGKSGGYRTLIVYKEKDRAIFVYGFSKSEKDNLDNKELIYLKKLANDLLKISKIELINLVKLGVFFRLEE